MRPPACVQVDVDDLPLLARHWRLPDAGVPSRLLDTLPRLKALFDRLAIKATFFFVGNDLRQPAVAALARQLQADGHELAAHSQTHPAALAALPEPARREEVAAATRTFREVFGAAPAGFRAPNYEMDEAIIAELAAQGYRYDSSVFPCSISPLLRARYERESGVRGGKYLGDPRSSSAPAIPYRMDHVIPWRRGAGPLWEVPVTTFPWLGLPLHGSFVLGTGLPGELVARLGLALNAWLGRPLTFVLHLCDLMSPPAVPGLERHRGLLRPLAEKEAVIGSLLELIVCRYRVLTTTALLAELEGPA